MGGDTVAPGSLPVPPLPWTPRPPRHSPQAVHDWVIIHFPAYKDLRWRSPLSTAFQAPTDCLVQSQLQPTPSTCPQRPLNSNGFSSG